MTIQCCQCKKIQAKGGWIDVSGKVGGLISHSYCPECSDAFLQEIRQERSRAESAARPAFEAT